MARGKDKEKASILQRQSSALDLRQSGWSFRAIGEKLGISHVQAWQDVKDALQELQALNADKAEDYRQLELERLDALTKALEPMAMVGNTNSVNAYIRVMEQRAKLLGLYAPEKHENIDWRSKAIDDIKAGRIQFEDLASAFDTGLAEELFKLAGVSAPAN